MKAKPILVMLGLMLALASSAPARSRFKVLHSFGSGKDGSGPYGQPVLDSQGNLYGVTGSGGTGQCSDYGCGTVYELTPQANGTWSESILHDFTAGSDGAIPWGGLVFDSAGDLYGTLVGDSGLGGRGIFELSPGSGGWSNARIYADAAGPGLLIDSDGNLYGEMGAGQNKYYGAIAELSPDSGGWSYTALYSFCSQQNCADGYGPSAPPIWDGKGNMFGTTHNGGDRWKICWLHEDGCGVIFEMTPSGDGTWTYHVLHRFASSKNDGQSPAAGLIMDKAGDFYGSTAVGGPYGRQDGGYGNGTVFKFSFTGGRWKKTVLYAFPKCSEGCNPGYEMVFDKAGNLYGAAGEAGPIAADMTAE